MLGHTDILSLSFFFFGPRKWVLSPWVSLWPSLYIGHLRLGLLCLYCNPCSDLPRLQTRVIILGRNWANYYMVPWQGLVCICPGDMWLEWWLMLSLFFFFFSFFFCIESTSFPVEQKSPVSLTVVYYLKLLSFLRQIKLWGCNLYSI